MNQTVTTKRKIFSAIFLMASASIGPLFLLSTAEDTFQFKENLAFIIIMTAIIELGIQMNVWRILTTVNQPANIVIEKIIPKSLPFTSVLILLGGVAFNILNIAGLGIGMSLLFNIDVKLGASIGLLIGILIFLFNKNRITLYTFVIVLFSFIVSIILLSFLFVMFDVPYSLVFARTVIPDIEFNTITSIATMVALSIGGYISFSGAHRLIDIGVTGEQYKKEVTKSAAYSVLIVTAVRFILFLTILGLTNKNVIIFEDNILEGAFLEIFGDIGIYALGILFVAASISSIIGATYTIGTFIKPMNVIIKTHIDTILMMIVLTSWFVYLLTGEDVMLIKVASILNGLIIPVILGGVLHASKRKDITKSYKHPSWLFVYGVISLIVLFVLVFISIYDILQLSFYS